MQWHLIILGFYTISKEKNLASFYYVELGRVKDAIKIYINILKRNPNDIETLLILGHVSVALENYEDAYNFYQRVLHIEPSNAYANESLNRLKGRNYHNRGYKLYEEQFQNFS